MDLKQLLSIDEKKLSATIVALYLSLIFYFSLIVISLIYKLSIKQFYLTSLVDIIQALILGLVGVSATSTLQTFLEYKNQVKQLEDDAQGGN